jgi:hypothetical protein
MSAQVQLHGLKKEFAKGFSGSLVFLLGEVALYSF